MGFLVEIITPKGIYLSESIESLTIKLTSGYRTFLAGHLPLIGSLGYGSMHFIQNGETRNFAVHGGAINVRKEKTTIICNAIEEAKDIDEARAIRAKERAEARLKEKADNLDVKRAQLALQRAIARLETIGK